MDQDFLREMYPRPLVREQELAHIVAAHRPVTFLRNEILLAEGQQCDEYYVVQTGWVREYVAAVDGTFITSRFFGPGSFVLEPASMFQRIPSRTNLKAITEGSGYVVSFEHHQMLYHQLEGMREWGRAWMSNELFVLRQRMIDMLRLSATDRYLGLLQEQPELLAYTPLKYVASYLGITESSLSRIRKEISRCGGNLS